VPAYANSEADKHRGDPIETEGEADGDAEEHGSAAKSEGASQTLGQRCVAKSTTELTFVG